MIDNSHGDGNWLKALALIGQLGFAMIGSVLVLGVIGFYFYTVTGMKWVLFLGIVLGVVTGFRITYRLIKKICGF